MATEPTITVRATADPSDIACRLAAGWGVLAYVTRAGTTFALLTRMRKPCRTGRCDWLGRAICDCGRGATA